MRVLVSGGAGFIGSHIVEGALAAGHTVAVLDNLSSGKRSNLPSGVPLFEVDLRDRARLAEVLSDLKPDLVSHQAAQASVAVSVREPHLDAEINVLGGLNLLDACVAQKVKKVVFASTGGAIYGEVPEGQRAAESTRPSPNTIAGSPQSDRTIVRGITSPLSPSKWLRGPYVLNGRATTTGRP